MSASGLKNGDKVRVADSHRPYGGKTGIVWLPGEKWSVIAIAKKPIAFRNRMLARVK